MRIVILLSLFFILSLISVSAALDPSETEWYTFENTLISNGTDDNVNNVGGTTLTVGNGAATYTTGFLGDSAIDLDGDRLTHSAFNGLPGYNWTTAMWIYIDTIENADIINYRFSGGGGSIQALQVQASGNMRALCDEWTEIVTYPINAGEWFHAAFTCEQGEPAKLYINGTLVASSGGTIGTTIGMGDFNVGAEQGTSANFDGKIDDLRVYWLQTIDADDISELYNSGVGLSESINTTITAPIVQPTITVLHPGENSFLNNNSVVFNVTVSVDPSTTFSNYTIYVNNTPIFTQTGQPDNVTWPIGDSLYNLTAIVRDELGNEANFDVSRWIVDTVNPGDNLLTQIPDPTTYYSSQNVTITALNTNLFGHNVTIRDSLDNILFSEEDLNISQPQNNIIAMIDAVWGAGTYTIVSNESDDHTINEIPNYAVVHNNANKMISFDTGDASVSVVLVESFKQVGAAPYTPINSNILSIVNNKQTDRYTFGFDFSNPAADSYKYKFEIVTDDDIIYRESSPYEGHFVLNDANWLDFEPYDVTVTHDGNSYFVEFETTDTEIRFESIGGTNIGTTQSTFILSVPSAPGIECGVNGVRADCSTLAVGDSLTGMYSTCANAVSSFHSLFLTSSNVSIDSGFASDIGGDEYYFNSTDALMVDGSTVDFNATCINDVGQIDSQAQIQTTTVSVPVDASTLNGWSDGAGLKLVTFIVTILVIILMFALLRGGFRK